MLVIIGKSVKNFQVLLILLKLKRNGAINVNTNNNNGFSFISEPKITHKTHWISAGFLVRLIGLEPTQPELPDPKSGASTNFATGAGCGCKGSAFLDNRE